MKNQKSNHTLLLVQAAMIAALYVVLTYIANAMGLASSAIQIRFSEALTILPYFTPAAIPGLFVGCFLSNILTGCAIPDIIFGSIATLIGALLTTGCANVNGLRLFPRFWQTHLLYPLCFCTPTEYSLSGCPLSQWGLAKLFPAVFWVCCF